MSVLDSTIMLRRDFKHSLRNPGTLFAALFFPVIMLLMFVYVFGGAFSAGGTYLNYVVPGILVLTMGYGTSQTAVAVATDITQGVMNRFRVMAISRAAVLTGQLLGSVIRTIAGAVVVLLVALLMGFEPHAGLGGFLGALGLAVLLVVGMTWLSVAFGLWAKSPNGAAFASFPLVFLPYVSSAFAPPDTMPGPMRAFADAQPMTPMIESIRGLLVGAPVGGHVLAAVVWWVVIGMAAYVWARRLFGRDPVR
ncbi:ABC transporter permease [Kibdelosporangium lantanae]